MKILLVEPHLGVKRNWLYRFFFYQSLALEQIAALTPDSHSVDIIDEKIGTIDFTKKYDLIGISCLTCNVQRGYEIADEFRRQGNIVVLGGYHPTALPEEAKKHADAVVIGEAELLWGQLLNDIENKELKPFYKTEKIVDPEMIPPARRIEHQISSITSIQASRGCPNKCKFCSMHNIERTKFRPRPIENVINEIKSIKGKNLFFVDSSLTINPNYSKSLFQEMVGLNKRFECFGNVDILAKDEELLKLASKAGCISWIVGIESLSQENIDIMGKVTNKVKRYEKSIQNIKNHGMMVTGLFMYGFDNDKTDVFDNTLRSINKWDLDNASFSIVTPYPGTFIFKQLKKEGRITSYDWKRYTEGHVNFKPKHMTSEELLQGIIRINKKYYSFSNQMNRCLGSNNLSPSLIINKVSRNLFSTKLFNKELFNY
jgi:radical SAM superfamily enzyme YgiQ (UPF0313 family)